MDYEREAPPPPLIRRQQEQGGDSRILVSNLQPSVTADDIVELFSDIGSLIGARMTASGQAEVTYSRKADALKAIEAYHNR
jgi:RNA recognition motif-containing protein